MGRMSAVPQRITTETHQWVVAACIPVTEKIAKHAVVRQSVRTGSHLPDDLKIDALDVYCSACHRVYDDVCGEPCEAAESNEHLRGGPQGERKKRKHLYHDCDQTGCWDGVRLEHYAAS
jgi:hypothetical protein